MSSQKNSTKPKAHEEHGTVGAYIIGFILSLVFTIIPYYLVVNKVISGTALIVVILSIAMVQMVIQLVFFLHLGRGPKPLYNVAFFFATAIAIVVVIAASLIIMDNLYRTMSPRDVVLKQAQEENIAQLGGQETGACKERRQSHVMTISQGVVTPNHIIAQRCDTLSFINQDDTGHEFGFGVHPNDISYGGAYEFYVSERRPEVITLNQLGDFVFHDHEDEFLTGSFSVTE